MENRLASTTTYPELLELGPGQWEQKGKEGSTRQDQKGPTLQVWASGSIPGVLGSLGFPTLLELWPLPIHQRLSQGWREVPGAWRGQSRPHLPPDPYLVNHSINLHWDDEVSVVHWL